MKYIAFDYFSVKELISTRSLQSSDYKEAIEFVRFLKGEGGFEIKGALKGVEKEDGRFVISNKRDQDRLLVFDLTEFRALDKTNQNIITIFQKACRLALKLWNKIGFSPCEKVISGTSYIALLPFSFSTGRSYKVLLDQSPDSKRQGKRESKNFLVFYDGVEQNRNPPSLSALRNADKTFRNIVSVNVSEQTSSENNDSPNFVNITEVKLKGSSLSPHMGMEKWKKYLTESQKSFVFSDRLGPDILKGAAGTGKTLSLILRCVHQMMRHREKSIPLKAVFFTHSIATKNNIESLFLSNGGGEFLLESSLQCVLVTTLQEWCISHLGGRISATEYLDKDALESKNTQLLYISESFEEFLLTEMESSKNFISETLQKFFSDNDSWTISVHIQNEISTYIKGRANEDFDVYKELSRSKNSIPLCSDEDFSTIFHIYKCYQDKLTDLNLFDSDDITISALQETSTPIWRRRRIKSGYDVLYIDETHLFNLNELSLFHNLLKHGNTNIVFTIDRSQASGDNSITSSDVSGVIGTANDDKEEYGFNTVFRCSDQIINLASCILASGATLFSHLENPFEDVAAGFTIEEESLCRTPYIVNAMGIEDLIDKAFLEVAHITKELQISKNDVLMVPCDDRVLEKLKDFSKENDKNMVSIERRGDYDAVDQASKNSSYIAGAMEFIGGLEFPAVVIIGIDQDKFPKMCNRTTEATHFVKYSSFNQLYVAVTRAKYVVSFISDKTKGVSETIQNSIDQGLIISE